ncbi:apolipoprotein N-acyltransferase [Sphingomonas prati]|uniref:Apolipoprotein N-acyltransferase n=1 Tax=Sphingomonas prati TaxID=1843237 RepID=A0A7W9BRG3_9SPHN|nr:apolipoprotein N-acyltransferase [Sphingomonas prati]MBB5728621.1 apolipoprotein N-acyltransferase [Sphingomonas prati]GGE72350.1 apolipoprotein N-acyltransferase [Sphingomonas prati]
MTPRTSPTQRALAAGALGLVSATGFAPLGAWPLTIGALAGLLYLLTQARSARQAAALGWWFGFGQFALGLNWIATAFTYQAAMPAWLGWLAVLLLAIYLAVFPAIAAAIAWLASGRRTMPLIFAFAGVWPLTEWVRATLFTGFAWNPLGVAWIGLPTAQAARYVGTYGLSALMVLAGGAVLAAALRKPGTTAAAAVLPLALSLTPTPAARDTGRAIHVVQPNIDQDARNHEDYAYNGLLKLARLSGRPAAGAPARLLFWPEAAVEYYLETDRLAREALTDLLRPADLLVTGGTRLERDDRDNVIGARNSLFVMDARGRLLHRYDKAHLVPYGEYLPMRALLSPIGLSRLVPGDIDFWPGPGPRSFALPGFGKIGVQICYEIIFSGHVVDRANRPDFIFNPSNDAWFGGWGPPQHLAQARLRAIEEGLPVVRATPNGISALIDPAGRLLRTIPTHRAGAIDTTLPAPFAATPFARFGNLLPLVVALALLAIAAIARRSKRG